MILMRNVNYLVGSENINNTPLRIFDDEVCSFISEISSTLFKSTFCREMPDLAALAFWGRKANLQKMKQLFGEYSDRLGRGLCFHITPSNIPVNFAFSYFFALLAGNASIVRLPSKKFIQVDVLCTVIKNIITSYPKVQCRTAFVSYPRDNEITSLFSLNADARMIWGGDNTIALVKTFKTHPRCVDIAFADRYSLAILDGQSILEADDKQFQRLIENFYNDTFSMDQNACSSPQILLWQNDNDKARERFWNAFYAYSLKKYLLQDSVAVDKYTKFCELAIGNENIISIKRMGNIIYRAELASLDASFVDLRGKGGFFYEYTLYDWCELFEVVTDKIQTITFFGIDDKAFRKAILSSCVRGIDRVVPIGKAMDISVFWDGHDLIRELSRVIKDC